MGRVTGLVCAAMNRENEAVTAKSRATLFAVRLFFWPVADAGLSDARMQLNMVIVTSKGQGCWRNLSMPFESLSRGVHRL